jgi:hypothetical protein
MDTKTIIELVSIGMMPFGFLLIMIHRISGKRPIATTKFIQLTSVVFAFPTLLVLGFEKVIEAPSLGTLLGALIGYLLSGVGSNERD